MKLRGSSNPLVPFAALSIAVFLSVLGVVMADTHEPQAVEPDAPRPDGVQVATFALG